MSSHREVRATWHWWLRLRHAAWKDAFRQHPVRRVAALLAWWVPWVALPLVAAFSEHLARALVGLLLSIDVPLALALAGVTTARILRLRAERTADAWLWPPAFAPRSALWRARLRWWSAARWPLGLALAAALLRPALPDRLAGSAAELWLMSVLALAGGLGFAWLLHNRAAQDARPARPRRARGLAALSWAPLHETLLHLDPRRLPLLAMPALLAAPAGAQFRQAMEVLLGFMAVVAVVTTAREAWRVQQSTRRWLRDAPLPVHTQLFWIWKHVATMALALLALGAAWSAITHHATGGRQ